MLKMNKNLLKALVLTSVIVAPMATVVSCGKTKPVDNRINVAYITSRESTLADPYNREISNASEAATEAVDARYKAFVNPNHDDYEKHKEFIKTLVDRKASLVIEPGYRSSKVILDDAQNFPETIFLGVSYSKDIINDKGGDDRKHELQNTTLYESLRNIGSIVAKRQEQGFLTGYLSASKYFTDHATEGTSQVNAVNFSTIGTTAFQDTSAMMDGYIAGVNQYAAENSKFVKLIAPKADGTFFTNAWFHHLSEFNQANKNAVAYLKTQNVKLLFPSDLNAVKHYDKNGFTLVADYATYNDSIQDVVVWSKQKWNQIMKTAVASALKNKLTFNREYHAQTHLASFKNNELELVKSSKFDFSKELSQKAADALKQWNIDNRTDPKYSTIDAHENETMDGTCKGAFWIVDFSDINNN